MCLYEQLPAQVYVGKDIVSTGSLKYLKLFDKETVQLFLLHRSCLQVIKAFQVKHLSSFWCLRGFQTWQWIWLTQLHSRLFYSRVLPIPGTGKEQTRMAVAAMPLDISNKKRSWTWSMVLITWSCSSRPSRCAWPSLLRPSRQSHSTPKMTESIWYHLKLNYMWK